MPKKTKSKRPKPRDPSWRQRRALGVRREDSAKAYKRADRKSAARTAARDEGGEGDESDESE